VDHKRHLGSEASGGVPKSLKIETRNGYGSDVELAGKKGKVLDLFQGGEKKNKQLR